MVRFADAVSMVQYGTGKYKLLARPDERILNNILLAKSSVNGNVEGFEVGGLPTLIIEDLMMLAGAKRPINVTKSLKALQREILTNSGKTPSYTPIKPITHNPVRSYCLQA